MTEMTEMIQEISFCFQWESEFQGLKLPEPVVGDDIARSLLKQPLLSLWPDLLKTREKVSESILERRKEK